MSEHTHSEWLNKVIVYITSLKMPNFTSHIYNYRNKTKIKDKENEKKKKKNEGSK